MWKFEDDVVFLVDEEAEWVFFVDLLPKNMKSCRVGAILQDLPNDFVKIIHRPYLLELQGNNGPACTFIVHNSQIRYVMDKSTLSPEERSVWMTAGFFDNMMKTIGHTVPEDVVNDVLREQPLLGQMKLYDY